MALQTDRQHAQELMDRMTPRQVSAVVTMLEAMLDPDGMEASRVPYEDERISVEEERDADRARLAASRGEVTTHDAFLQELGLTLEDIENFDKTRGAAGAHR